jgi:phosphoribosylformimino-5-aminoimidazole carboxamide ribotide isomerase
MIDIIPAIDLIDGKCARLEQGDFSKKKVYDADPTEIAATFESAGVKRLHIVDLDGARKGRIGNLGVVQRIASRTTLTIDFGGGIKTNEDMRSVFDAGAAIANIGSTAVREPENLIDWIERFGSERILLGTDVKSGKIAINGWQTETGLELVSFLSGWKERGITQAFATDIAKDGMLGGPSTELYIKIRDAIPDMQLIASGGVRSMEDVYELESIGCAGVIIGKAFYEREINLDDLERFTKNGQSSDLMV